MLDNLDDVRAELATVIDMVKNDKIHRKLQEILDYLDMIEERVF
jgi:hypothetical protein